MYEISQLFFDGSPNDSPQFNKEMKKLKFIGDLHKGQILQNSSESGQIIENNATTVEEIFINLVDSFDKGKNSDTNGTDNSYDAVEISEDTNVGFDILGILGGNVKSNKTITKVKDKDSKLTDETISKIIDEKKSMEINNPMDTKIAS